MNPGNPDPTRRHFLGDLLRRAAPPADDAGSGDMPMRPFGRADVKVSALGMGGHHLGDVKTVDEAVRLVQEAVDSGITFFDNCWEYHNGKSEDWLGRGLKGRRDKVFLMTKVCTHGRGKGLALQMLDESLRRLQTDHLDLWQVHGVSFDNDPELAYRKGGVTEALDEAKKQGKVRFVGFTGHKDPSIHLKMLELGYPFDSVQMPLNPFDAGFHSFEKQVLPELTKRGIAALGMKSMNGKAEAVKKGLLKAEEMLRYAMSLPVATTITGIDAQDVLHQNLRVARGFKPLTPDEMDELRKRCAPTAADGRYRDVQGVDPLRQPGGALPAPLPARPDDQGTQGRARRRGGEVRERHSREGTEMNPQEEKAGPDRRDFLHAGLAGAGAVLAAPLLAAAPDPLELSDMGPDKIPRKPFGKTNERLSVIGLGGFSLASAPSFKEAESILNEALDAGVNFLDNAWEYHDGRAEEWMGRALKGRRDKVFLMTKVCTHGRDKAVAMKMLEESLKRLQTDHLDLWQIHEVVYNNDPDLHFAKGGVVEALEEAKKQGKVRYVGFTGHKHPAIHLKMLAHDFPFDSVQMPLNCFDASYRSFEKDVLPEVVKRGMAGLGMKSMGGGGQPILQGAVTAGGAALRHEPAGVGHDQRHRLTAGAAPELGGRPRLHADEGGGNGRPAQALRQGRRRRPPGVVQVHDEVRRGDRTRTAWLSVGAGIADVTGSGERGRMLPDYRALRLRGADMNTTHVPMTEEAIQVPAGGAFLEGTFRGPEGATAAVLFAHGSGSSRHSPRNRYVAESLQKAGLATVLLDLLTPEEEAVDVQTAEFRFDIGLLAERVVEATDWLTNASFAAGMTIGCFGASTGAAAALIAAADRHDQIKAVVSRGGRPDLAGPALSRVQAPTLLLVGGNDDAVLALNEEALARLGFATRNWL